MLHFMAARVLLMVADYGVEIADAIAWVCRRIPRNLRRYYAEAVLCELVSL
jgi:hypothetical protein